MDYRELNHATVKGKYLIPVIEEKLDELGNASIFSIIDLRSRHWQGRMDEDDIHKMTFKTREGHYKF